MRPIARCAFLIAAVAVSRPPVLLTQELLPVSELKTATVANGVEWHGVDRGNRPPSWRHFGDGDIAFSPFAVDGVCAAESP